MPIRSFTINLARHPAMTSPFKRPLGLIAAMSVAMAFPAPGAFADSAGVTFSRRSNAGPPM